MRLPKNRPPTHPGEILREEFLAPRGLTQEKLAEELGISFQRINGIINGKRSVTAETALLLSSYFGTTADFWINSQTACDLYEARERLGNARLSALMKERGTEKAPIVQYRHHPQAHGFVNDSPRKTRRR